MKDGELHVGSNGLEWVDTDTGAVVNHDPEWVKLIDSTGGVRHRNWGAIYRKIRELTNTSRPGYLWHEAVDFDPLTRRWLFLPRKASQQRYHPLSDEHMGTNILVIASEDFESFKVVNVGDVTPDFGFTAVRKLPRTQTHGRVIDDLYMALKVREVGDETKTVVAVFDTAGQFYSEPQWISTGEQDRYKYEGLELV